MASFNSAILNELLTKIRNGDEMVSSAKKISQMTIPYKVGVELNVVGVLTPLQKYAPLEKSIFKILKKLETSKKAEERKNRPSGGVKKVAARKHTALFKKCLKMRKNLNVV